MDLLEIDSESGLTGTLIEVTLDLAGFFGRRGVQRVIKIESGEPDSSEPSSVPPESSPGGDDEHPRDSVKIDPKPTLIDKGEEGERAELYTAKTGTTTSFNSRNN